MKHATLFIAPLGARNKKKAIFREIVSLYPGNDFSSVLYLAPDNFVLSAVKREFFAYLKSEHNKSAYISFQAFTIKQLARNLYDMTPPSPPLNSGGGGGELPSSAGELPVISEQMRILILCAILKETNIGYARLLSDLFRKIRHYTPDKDLSRLKEEIRQSIFEERTRDRAIAATEVLQSYESFLNDKKLIDTEDMLKRCVSIINQSKAINPLSLTPYALPLNETLVIEGFFDPTPLEFEMIKALADNAGNTLILAEENTELMRHFLSQKEGVTVRELERSVFRVSSGYFSYNSIEEEVEGIAGNISKLILENVKPWEITVCFPSLSQYLPMLKRIFNKYGIPVSISNYDLSSSKQLALLEDMIACIENDYPRNDLLSILTSPYLPGIHDAVKTQAVKYSYRAGIIKGKDPWLSIEDIIKGSGNDMSESEKNSIAEFQKGITPVIDAIEKIKKAGDIGAFSRAFESALDKFGFFAYLKEGHSVHGERTAEGIKNQFSGLRQFAELYGTVLQADDAGFYLRHLLSDLTASDENVDGVNILPFELAAAVESKALFFGGVTEGSFPSRPPIDPVLPEKFKKSLSLPHLEYYLERQRLYFARLMNASIYEPYISCPSADGDKIFLPSPFLDWERMMAPASLNIFTQEDVFVSEGSALDLKNTTGTETYFDAKAIAVLRGKVSAMSKRYFRVTDLDYYRKCPFKFYLEKILGLEIDKPPRFEVEYRQWGNLAHRTMEHLFEDKNPELDTFEKRLFQALEKSLKEIPIGEFWANVTREIFRNLLPRLKEQESEIRKQGFGPDRIEEKIEAEINGIKLRGKIDRVDRKEGVKGSRCQGARGKTLESSDPLTLEPSSVILLDYKTGAVDSKSLQLPLYALIWNQEHSEHVEAVGYYSLKEGGINWYPSKKKSMEEYTQAALRETGALIEQMKEGMFPAEPAGNECRYCDHRALCEK